MGSEPACFGSSMGSIESRNLFKKNMGNISKGVANSQKPAKKIKKI
jgi:hypothetical protein